MDDDQRGPLGLVDAVLEGALEGVEVVAVVDVLDVPLLGLEALADVFAEDHAHRAGQGDLVGVVQVDQLAQPQMAGQAGRLVRDALHQVAVRDQAEGAMVDDRVAVAVVGGGQVRLGQRQADAIREALTEWASRQLDAWRMAVLGMARVRLPHWRKFFSSSRLRS